MTVARDHISHHRHVAELYEEAFRHVDGITYHKELEGLMASNYWLSAITLREELRVKGEELAYQKPIETAIGGAAGVVHRGGGIHTDCEPNINVEAMRIALQAENIESRPLWKPMHKQPVYQGAPKFRNFVKLSHFFHLVAYYFQIISYLCTHKSSKTLEDMSEKQKLVEKERKGVLELLLKKTGLKYKELVDAQIGMWMAGNIDLLSAEEKKQFPHMVF
jgi:hypothetical protein